MDPQSAPTVLLFLLPPWGAQRYHPVSLLFLHPSRKTHTWEPPSAPSTWKIVSPETLLAHPPTSCLSLHSLTTWKGLPWPPYLTLHTTPALHSTCQAPNLLFVSLFHSVVIFRLTTQGPDLSCLLVIDKKKHMLHRYRHKHWSSPLTPLLNSLAWMKYLEEFLA